jgi:hypothetical protein
MAPRLGARVMGHLGARVSSPIGVKGAVSQAWGSRSFSRRVLHLDPHAWPTSGRARRRDGIPASTPPFIRAEQTTVVLSACCNEGSIAVNRGTPRCRPSAGQRASPGMVDRFPSSPPIPRAFGGLRSRMAPGLGQTVVGHQGHGIPALPHILRQTNTPRWHLPRWVALRLL